MKSYQRIFLALPAAIAIFVFAAPSILRAAGDDAAGNLKSLTIETGRTKNNAFVLSGRDSGQQLIVTGKYAAGGLRDLTASVNYSANPAGIIGIDKHGYVTAVKEGKASIRVQLQGANADIHVSVTDIVNDLPVNFANEIVPIFTRFDCNSGGCHGKSGGQNGFQLSLLGFVPEEDYEHVVLESYGRRVLPASPQHSLLLMKASGQIGHGGGGKIDADSPHYRMIKRWMEQGMPYGKKDDPVVSRIEILPRERTLAKHGRQQLAVVAHFSDGSTRDVTRLTQFEPNAKGMAEVSKSGLVEASDLPGIVAVMARFQAHVDVFRATIPLGVEVANLPKSNNFIDTHVFAQWKKLGLPPSDICDDSTFIRRVTVDIAGRLPTVDETKKFLADKSPEKRELLVDRLLATGDYADLFANKWSAVLRNRRKTPNDDPKATFAFHAWIRDGLHKNKPYDRFVREIVTATGKEVQNPPVTWYNEVKEPSAQVEDVAQLFLGQRIQCARCHHHPFEKWSQKDYYGMTAFFSQVAYKIPPKAKGNRKKNKKRGKKVTRPLLEVYLKPGLAQAKHPRTGEVIFPAGLGAAPLNLPKNADPRTKLAQWMTSPDNAYFARALVNRYWKHFFGRGIVDPEDDMRVTNPATNPELLRALEQHFIKKKYDLKELVRTICTSRTYQLSAVSNDHNKRDNQSFSRYYPRRLNAEVLFDAIDQVTMSNPKFAGVPAGTRAVQLPDNAFQSYFLSVFGRPDSASACECERNSDANLAQLLHLINSTTMQQKISGGRVRAMMKDRRPHAEKLRDLYLAALSRQPSAEELKVLAAHIEAGGERNVQTAYQDIVWAIVNGEEFLFNH